MWIETPESSNIVRFRHVDTTLTVQFKHGGAYNYYDVPVEIFEAMTTAESKGSFLATSIKKHFRYAKVELQDA